MTNATEKFLEEAQEYYEKDKHFHTLLGQQNFEKLLKLCRTYRDALEYARNLSDTDFLKTETDDNEVEFWVNDSDLVFICETAFEEGDKICGGE